MAERYRNPETRRAWKRAYAQRPDVIAKRRLRGSTTERAYRRRLREKAIAFYGGKCKCCGESQFEFLTFDHKNGDGGKERKAFGDGYKFYRSLLLVKREDIQVLCYNCNNAKAYHGVCPHER